jgi:aspartate-semialdehyde dehydrogenase
MALSPLHNAYKIKRLVISTYQSVSGSGAKAVNQLMDERKEIETDKEYPFQIDLNLLPHAGDFNEEGYTSEEIKIVNETNKILDANINTTATVVRVPVITCHSESVNIEFENDFTVDEVKYLLESMPGVVVFDLPHANIYPMPILAVDKDEVMVGRIRRDFSQPRTLNMWVVADNLRKGAATNAVQIAQYLISNGMVN